MFFDKLLKHGVQLYLVRILCFGTLVYSNNVHVRWNNVICRGFGVSNGVGPTSGDCVSVYLFCVYMCGLRKLKDTKVGCMGVSLLLSVC